MFKKLPFMEQDFISGRVFSSLYTLSPNQYNLPAMSELSPSLLSGWEN